MPQGEMKTIALQGVELPYVRTGSGPPPSAKQKREDSECGGYTAHFTSIAEPKKNAHMGPGQFPKNQYIWYNNNQLHGH